jgi:ribosomal-protein-alanine N-acetyltransferase
MPPPAFLTWLDSAADFHYNEGRESGMPAALSPAQDACMTSMATSRPTRQNGLRLLDPGRDLFQVADLIEEAFASEMGEPGFAAVRELRAMAAMGPLWWTLSRLSADFQDSFTGFVWEEDGRIVGNVTVTRTGSGSSRWQISNVAVQRDFRGRGIGRRLMEAAIALARERGGEWALLQVRHDNMPALHLYESLGFESLYSSVELYRVGPAEPLPPTALPAGWVLRRLGAGDWRSRHALQMAAVSPLERWVRNIPPTAQPPSWVRRAGEIVSAFLLGGGPRTEGAFAGGRLVALVEARPQGFDAWRLTLLAAPDVRGQVEETLVVRSLEYIRPGKKTRVECEHPAGHQEGITALKACGFQERRTLITMRRRL